MSNPFEQFKPANNGGAAGGGDNPFAQFAAPQPTLQRKPVTPAAPPEKSGLLRRVVGDSAVDVGRGVLGLGEAAVGLLNIPTLGGVGKTLEMVGYDPQASKDMLGEFYSPERKVANEKVAQAEGFVDTAAAMLENPSTIVGGIVESAPSIAGGGALARGAGMLLSRAAAPTLAAIPRSAPGRLLLGAAGEGAMMAGAQAEGIRQQTDDGMLTPEQSALAAGTGVIGGGLGIVGGNLARKLGIGDVDTLAAGGVTQAVGDTAEKGMLRRAAEGALVEGAFEELPQSVAEQALSNVALDNPITEGLGNAAAAGLLTGAALGGVIGAVDRPEALADNGPARTPPPAPITEAALRAAVETAPTPEAKAQAQQQLAQLLEQQGRMLPAPGQEPITVTPDGEARTPAQTLGIAQQRAGELKAQADIGLTPDVLAAQKRDPRATLQRFPNAAPGSLADVANVIAAGQPATIEDIKKPIDTTPTAGVAFEPGDTMDPITGARIPAPAPTPQRNVDPQTGEVSAQRGEEAARSAILQQLEQGRVPDLRLIAGATGVTPRRAGEIRSEIQQQRKAEAKAKAEGKPAPAPAAEQPAPSSVARGGETPVQDPGATGAAPSETGAAPQVARPPLSVRMGDQEFGVESVEDASRKFLELKERRDIGGMLAVRLVDQNGAEVGFIGQSGEVYDTPLSSFRANPTMPVYRPPSSGREPIEGEATTIAGDLPAPAAATPAAAGVVPIKGADGSTYYVKQADVDRKQGAQLPLYDKAGARLKGKTIHRDNLDPTGEKFEASKLPPQVQRSARGAKNDADAAFKTADAALNRVQKQGLPAEAFEPVQAGDGFIAKLKPEFAGMTVAQARAKIAEGAAPAPAAEAPQPQPEQAAPEQGSDEAIAIADLEDPEERERREEQARARWTPDEGDKSKKAEFARKFIVPASHKDANPWKQTARTRPYEITRRRDMAGNLVLSPATSINYYQDKEGGNEHSAAPSITVRDWNGAWVLDAARYAYKGKDQLPYGPFDTKAEAIKAAEQAIRGSALLDKFPDGTEFAFPAELSLDPAPKAEKPADAKPAEREALPNATAPEQVAPEEPGVTVEELGQIAKEFRDAIDEGKDAGITRIFDSPKPKDVVRLAEKAKVYHKDHGWMTPAEAKARIAEWKTAAKAQGKDPATRSENANRIVLSLFDLTGSWSQPWEDAGYQVYRFDIQNEDTYEDPETGETRKIGDVRNMSVEFFADLFGDFDGNDIHAVLAACPCTDFAVSGARHFAAKDADGRTVASVELVKKTLALVEYYKPAIWAVENPVGRIEKLTGLPPWRLSFDPNHVGDPYTKKTLLWGRFNADLPIAPVEPTEGSKMHRLYGGKSMKTKNARSETPEGFSYAFFMANNAADHPLMTLANKYDRLPKAELEKALAAGLKPTDISEAIDDAYYQDVDDEAAVAALRELVAESAEAATGIAAAAAEAATSPANDLPAPTEAQKEAGNYKKGHVVLNGLDITIENPAGTKRREEWPALAHHYGYIKRTEGADGDHVDVFMSDDAANPDLPVFVIDQRNPDGGFDEHKVMLGFADEAAAAAGYLASYTKGWKGLGSVTRMTLDGFKTWLREGDTTKPAAPAADAPKLRKVDIAAAQTMLDRAPAGSTLTHKGKTWEKVEGRMSLWREQGKPLTSQALASSYFASSGVQEYQPPANPAPTTEPKAEKAEIRPFRRPDGSIGYEAVPIKSAAPADQEYTDAAQPAETPNDRTERNSGRGRKAAARGDSGERTAAARDDDAALNLDGRQPEGAAQAGEGREPAAEAAQPGSESRGSGGRDGVDGERDGGGSPADVRAPTHVVSARNNFTITNELDFTGAGEVTKFKNNVEAIRLLKTLEAEGRNATDAEQSVLAKFVGWGGLPKAFDPKNSDWAERYAELKGLLTDDEWNAAARSTQDAHYTSREVVDGMWAAVRRLGFDGGRVLEPSMGTGNFFGLMPQDLRTASRLNGVELDSITGRIAKKLYPKASITVRGFNDTRIQPDSFDLAIGNPPFGSQAIFDPQYPEESKQSIHNYFFMKSLASVRPGGVMAMVVSNFLMDAQTSTSRQWMSERARLLGAFRLPNTAFKSNAGTSVTTDIVVFQRLAPGEQGNPDAWVKTGELEVDGQKHAVNQWFIDHPEALLGELKLSTHTTYGRAGLVLEPKAGDNLAARLAAAVETLPQGAYTPAGVPIGETKATTETPAEAADARVYGHFLTADGRLMQRQPDYNGNVTATPLQLEGAALERMKGMVGVRQAARALIQAESDPNATDAKIGELRAELNKRYDGFVKEHGYLSRDVNKRLFREDPDGPLLISLEKDYDRGVSRDAAKKAGVPARKESASKADIFTKRTNYPVRPTESVKDAKSAMLASLNERGRIDIEFVRRVYKKGAGYTEADFAAELGDLVFNDNGELVPADAYLSGNVKAKLAAAIELAKKDPSYQRNVEALAKVQPPDKNPVDIFVRLGTPWIPTSDYDAFARDTFEGSVRGNFLRAIGRWEVTVNSPNVTLNNDRWGTPRMSASAILEALMGNKPIVIYDKTQDDKRILNQEATAAAKGKAAELEQAFAEWVWKDAERRERLARYFNDTFNTDVPRKFDGSHLTLPGMNRTVLDGGALRPHQSAYVYRALQDGRALADHVVGAGKTFAAIATVMEMRRLGISRKPMVVVPNHLVDQWAKDFVKLYPGANILAASRKDFEKGNRQRLFSRIATGDWDAVIVAHSSFGFIPLPPEQERAILDEQVAEIQAAMAQLRESEGKNSLSVKQLNKQKEALEEKLDRLAKRPRDQIMDFAEMGVDSITLDEAHEFKNLFFATSLRGVAGLGSPAGSKKSFDLFVKTRYLMDRNGDKGVFFLTGTPVSNTLSEVFHMQRYLQFDALKERGLHTFDAWAGTFGAIVSDWEMDAAGRFKEKSRFAKFANMKQLTQIWGGVADVVTRGDLMRDAEAQGKRFPLPKLKTGKPINVVAQRSPLQANFIGVPIPATNPDGTPKLDPETGVPLESYAAGTIIYRMDNMPKDPKEDNHLKATNDARKAGLDFRLIEPSAPDFAGSKVNEAVNRALSIWKANDERKGTQLIFCDLSVPASARGKATEKAQAKVPTFFTKVYGDLQHVDGKKLSLTAMPDRPFFAVKTGKTWEIRETGSGVRVSSATSRQDAIDDANAELAADTKAWTERFESQAIPAEQIEAYVARWEEAQALKEAEADANEDDDAPAEDDSVSMDELLADESKFSVYDDIKAKLIAGGMPAEQIAFIHDYETDLQKAALFAKVNSGEIRVLLGSTKKMGAGMNVQRKLVALHHLDAPWRPSDLEQRDGRIIRQGNEFYMADPEGFEIEIYRYSTGQTYDARQWEIIEVKARGIEDFRSGQKDEIEDVTGEAASAADMKGAASGNPLILESIKLRKEVKELEAQERQHRSSMYAMESLVRSVKDKSNYAYKALASAKKIGAAIKPAEPFTITIGGKTYTDKADIKPAAFAAVFKEVIDGGKQSTILGTYRGVELIVTRPFNSIRITGRVEGDDVGSTEFGPEDAITTHGTLARIDNIAKRGLALEQEAAGRVAKVEREAKQAADELKRGFPKQAELDSKRERQKAVVQALRSGKRSVDGDAPAKDGDAPLFSQPAPLRSGMLAAIEAAQGAPKKADAAAWKGWMDGAVRRGEFKKSERDWLDVDGWLDRQDGKVTREALADYVRANQVAIEETVLDTANSADAYSVGPQDANNGWPVIGPGGFLHDWYDTQEQANRAAERLGGAPPASRAKFEQYRLKGGTNYREVLLTLPSKQAAARITFPQEHYTEEFLVGVSAAGFEHLNYERDPNDDNTIIFDSGLSPQLIALAEENRGRIADSSGQNLIIEQRGRQWVLIDTVESAELDRFDTEAEAVAERDAMLAANPAALPESVRRGAVGANAYLSRHWDQPNVLAHLRMADHVDAEGRKVLLVEEIQSDWHQEGRKKGYQTPGVEAKDYRIEPVGARFAVVFDNGVRIGTYPTEAAAEAAAGERAQARKIARSGQVPDAPLKGTGEWAMLAFKRAVADAVARGIDRIAWTPGELQAQRFDLSKQIRRVTYSREDGRLTAIGLNGDMVIDKPGIAKADLPDYVGKDVADKLLASEPIVGIHQLSGVELRMGGEGIRDFYDKLLPAEVKDWARKFKAQLSTTELPSQKGIKFAVLEITPAMREAALQGLPVFSNRAKVDPRLAEVYDEYESGDRMMTARDLLVEVQGIIRDSDDVPQALVDAAEAYAQEIDDDERLYGGRGADGAEDRFIDALSAAVGESLSAPTGPAAGVPAAELKAAVDKITAKWQGDAPPVSVAATPADLPAGLRGKPGSRTAEGVYWRGRVYLIASNLKSVARGMQVLAHEAFGHYGVEAVVGEREWGIITRDIGAMRKRIAEQSDAMRELLQGVQTRYPDASPEVFAKEAIAVMAENGMQASVLNRVVAAVRRFLRRLGLVEGFNETDLRDLVSRGMRRVERGSSAVSRGRDALAPAFSQALAELSRGFKALAKLDGVFKYPNSRQTDLRRLLAEYAPAADMRVVFERDAAVPVGEGEVAPARGYVIQMGEDGGDATVYIEHGEQRRMVLDASGLKAGQAKGSALYMALFNFALNTDRVFIGDPSGLSDDALLRRTELMAAAAIKFGTTRMMAPHPRQVSPDVKWATPLKWTPGADGANMEALLRASYQNTLNFAPGIADASYDFALQKYLGARGEPLPDNGLERLATGARGAFAARPRQRGADDPGESAFGRATIARAILANTLVRRAGTSGSELVAELERLGGRGADSVAPTALQRILYSQPGPDAAKPGEPLFSQPPSTDDVADAMRTAAKEPSIPQRVREAWEGGDVQSLARKGLLYGVTLRHIAELAGDLLPSLRTYVDTVQQMATDRNQMQESAAKLADSWEKAQRKNRRGADAMANLMHDATIAGVDPDVPYEPLTIAVLRPTTVDGKTTTQRVEIPVTRRAVDDEVRALKLRRRTADDATKAKIDDKIGQLEERLAEEMARSRAYPALLARWQELPDNFKDLYRGARQEYVDQSRRYEDALVARIESMMEEGKKRAAYVAQVRQHFESQRLKGPYFPLSRFGSFWISATDKNGADAFFMFEKKGEWRRAQADLKARGYTIKAASEKFENASAKNGPSSGFMADLMDTLAAAGVDDEAKDQVYQLYLRSLPDLSVRKHFIHRKKVAGYSQDALRAFSGNLFHGSFQIARLRHTHTLDLSLQAMKERERELAKTMPEEAAKAAQVLNEMTHRHEWVMNPKDSAVANSLTSLGFVWYLGVSPAAALINLSQVPIVSFPVLAAKWGAGKASRAILDGMKRAIGSVNGDITRGLSDEERRAFKVWYESGGIDKSMAHGLAGLSESDTQAFSPVYRRTMEIVSWLFHKAEVVNREATALAAFRLAREGGMSFDQATRYAEDTIWESQFDYTNANRARWMQGNVAKVVFLFRQYSLNMTWFLWRNAYQALKGERPEVKREAQRKLAGVLGMTGLFSGLLGMPLANVMFGLANAAAVAFGDDEEPWDAEVAFRNFLADYLGPDTARALTGGAVEAATGLEVSSRTSLNDLWVREPDRELEGEELGNYILQTLAGPMGGIGFGFLRGAQLMEEGHYWRALEATVPKFIRDGLRSIRYSTEGVNNLRGDPIIPELGLGETIAQLSGFGPSRLADQYDANNAVKGYEERLLKKRQRLLNAFAMAAQAGDEAALRDTLARVRRWNSEVPALAIDADSIRRSMAQRARYSERAAGGVVVDRRIEQQARAQARFAEGA